MAKTTRPPKSRFERDTELSEFLRSNLHRMRLDEARAECILRFGVARTPSRSAMHRFAERLEAEMERKRALFGLPANDAEPAKA